MLLLVALLGASLAAMLMRGAQAPLEDRSKRLDLAPRVLPLQADDGRSKAPRVPTEDALAEAKRYAASRSGLVSFAVVDSRGRMESREGTRPYVSASVVKALLLAGELHRLRGEALDPSTKELLSRMITYSDNTAADAIYARSGDAGLRAVAIRAGMRTFDVFGHWTTAQVTAEDMARFMANIDRVVPADHHEFASRQLASVVPEQRWGIPAAAGDGWRVRFKGGWRATELGQLVHQAAALERKNGERVAVAILTDGQPTMEYGIETVRGVASRLLAQPGMQRRRPG